MQDCFFGLILVLDWMYFVGVMEILVSFLCGCVSEVGVMFDVMIVLMSGCGCFVFFCGCLGMGKMWIFVEFIVVVEFCGWWMFIIMFDVDLSVVLFGVFFEVGCCFEFVLICDIDFCVVFVGFELQYWVIRFFVDGLESVVIDGEGVVVVVDDLQWFDVFLLIVLVFFVCELGD